MSTRLASEDTAIRGFSVHKRQSTDRVSLNILPKRKTRINYCAKANKFHSHHPGVLFSCCVKGLLNFGKSISMAASALAFLSKIPLFFTAFHFMKCESCHLASGKPLPHFCHQFLLVFSLTDPLSVETFSIRICNLHYSEVNGNAPDEKIQGLEENTRDGRRRAVWGGSETNAYERGGQQESGGDQYGEVCSAEEEQKRQKR